MTLYSRVKKYVHAAAWPDSFLPVFMTSSAHFQYSLSLASMLRAGIATLAVLLTVGLQLAPASTGPWFASEWLRDRFIGLHASAIPDERILVVDIDEASLTEIGSWPWPRTRLATLIENLNDPYQARGVALDLVLPEPADANGDLRLAMLALHAPLVLAAAFDYDLARIPPLRVGQVTVKSQPANAHAAVSEAAIAAGGFIGNHAGFAGARQVGNIGFIPDRDGVIRRLPLQTRFDSRLYPTLALALFDCCASASGATTGAKAITTTTSIATSNSLWRIPYSRQWGAYTVVSAADILAARIPVSAIRGRLALVGSSSLGLADRVATPLAASTSGLLVHAAALGAMLDAKAGLAPAAWPGAAIAILFVIMLAILADYTFPRLSAASNVLLLGAAALTWVGLAYHLAPHDGAVVLSAPLVSILFLLAVAVPFDWQLTQLKSRRLLGTLNQYVAKSVVDELLRSNLKDPLLPVEREVTTLIADMESYTNHVGNLPVQDAARLTRDFLDCLTRPVLAHTGTLDKYTGDGLVAFWGAPLANPHHADLALDAAYDIVLEVRRFSHEREARGLPRLRVRIGIESGIAMAGDFGSAFRSIYTAVGDSVNVASRLEQLARDYPHDIIVGPGTAASVRRHRLLPLGGVVLRGKEQATALYALAVAT